MEVRLSCWLIRICCLCFRKKVILHWFRRNEKDGMSEVISRDLDADGAFGDWPEDFADVSLNAEQEYLDTVTERHLGKAK